MRIQFSAVLQDKTFARRNTGSPRKRPISRLGWITSSRLRWRSSTYLSVSPITQSTYGKDVHWVILESRHMTRHSFRKLAGFEFGIFQLVSILTSAFKPDMRSRPTNRCGRRRKSIISCHHSGSSFRSGGRSFAVLAPKFFVYRNVTSRAYPSTSQLNSSVTA
jgi:hypothetical protein